MLLHIEAAERAGEVWAAVRDAGGADLVPAGLACRDSLRLEAGMPLYGNELDRTTTPYDAGLGRVVRLDKAVDGVPVDFVGRATLAARAERAPERVLVGLVGEGLDPGAATTVPAREGRWLRGRG